MDRAALELSLQATNASDIRDKELLQWLRGAVDWLPNYAHQIDICLLLIRVLCTFPWDRFVKGHTMSNTPGYKTTTKIMDAFEKLCCMLISRNAQLVVPALEAALRPFAVVGVRNAIPIDTATRIINHCAATYPSPQSIHLLFNSALDPLCPPKRWSSSFHHECYMVMLLNLALEAQLPARCSLVGGFKELSALTQSLGVGVGVGDSLSLLNGTPNSTPHATPSLSGLVGAAAVGVGKGSSAIYSAESGSDARRGLGLLQPIMSNEDASDATGVRGSGTGFLSAASQGGDSGVQLSGLNKLMTQQVRLIGLVLSKLLEMEIGIEYEDSAIESIVDERRRRKQSRKEAAQGVASVSSSIMSTPASTFFTTDIVSAESAAEQFAYEYQDPNCYESPIHMLKMCVARVFERLAADMIRRKAIGACDRPSWWSEVQAFHVDCVSRIKHPIALHFLAPSLAVLGVAGEASELMHKVVSAVLKGACEKRPSVHAAAAASVRPGMAARMVPPPSSEKLNPKQRVLAATHIYPLFTTLRSHLQSDTCEGIVRRLFKFVGSEGALSAPSSSAPSRAYMTSSSSTSSPNNDVVDSVLAQVISMCVALGRSWDEGDDIPAEVRARVLRQLKASASADTCTSGNGNGSSSAGAATASGQMRMRNGAGREVAGVKREARDEEKETENGLHLQTEAKPEIEAEAEVLTIDAKTMAKASAAYTHSGAVKPDLYTSKGPWASRMAKFMH